MSRRLYDVYFRGKFSEGKDIADVKKKLSILFKLNSEKIEQLFSGRPVAIRRGIDYQAAVKYEKLLRTAGARCEIRRITQGNHRSSEATSVPQQASSASNSNQSMICPKCEYEQPFSGECVRCGIIIKKYHGKQRKREKAASDNHDKTSEKTESEKTDENHSGIIKKSIKFKDLSHFSRKYFSRKSSTFQNSSKISEAISQAILMAILTAILYTGFLYLSKMMWYVYISTPVGKYFVANFTDRSQAIFYLFDMNLLYFSIFVTGAAFTICLIVSAICRVLHISRLLYHSRGMWGKMVYWGIPLAALVAHYLQSAYDLNRLEIAYLVAFIPTLFVFPACFKLSDMLLPEIGTLLQRAALIKDKFFGSAVPEVKKWVRDLIEKINTS